jgi:hypothetical protein
MVQSPSWAANSHSDIQKLLPFIEPFYRDIGQEMGITDTVRWIRERRGAKDGRGHRVDDTTGLENVDPVLVQNSSTFLANS